MPTATAAFMVLDRKYTDAFISVLLIMLKVWACMDNPPKEISPAAANNRNFIGNPALCVK